MVDAGNVFKHTYSKEDRAIGESRVGDLINRVYVGLPFTENMERMNQARNKNVCHAYLFENEDKKYNLDRLLFTCRAVLKQIERIEGNTFGQEKKEKIMNSFKFGQFAAISRDSELVLLLDSGLSIEEKRDILERKVKILKERRENNSAAWEAEDVNYFYFSLNQRLHNEINDLKKKLGVQYMASQLYAKSNLQAHEANLLLEGEPVQAAKMRKFLHLMLKYHHSNSTAVSQTKIDALIDSFGDKLLSHASEQGGDSEAGVSFPAEILQFGHKKFQEFVNAVIAVKLNSHSETTYYLGKALFKKLFNCELLLRKEEKVVVFDQFARTAKKRIEEMRKFFGKRGARSPEEQNNGEF